MAGLPERLPSLVKQRGLKARAVRVRHLGDLEREIRDRYERGLIHDRLYHEQLSFFSFQPPGILQSARSIIIVALPVPQIRLYFCWKGNRVAVLLQPNCEACSSMKIIGFSVETYCYCSTRRKRWD